MSARYLLAACFLFLRASAFAAPGCLFRFKGSYRDSGTQFVPVVIAFPGFIWIGGMTGSLDAADQIKVSLDVLQKGRAWRWSYAGDFKPSVWPQADLRWRSNKDDPKCQVSV
ncbi:MAG: hypothetical protein KGK30_07950, partial [Elusimicrobia bacterium]|nr:hypothetical protein [Elusimicrobiota bacterium]